MKLTVGLLVMAALGWAWVGGADGPALSFDESMVVVTVDPKRNTLTVAGLPTALLAESHLSERFRVVTVEPGDTSSNELPSVIGDFSVSSGDLTFSPKYTFATAANYRVLLADPSSGVVVAAWDAPAAAVDNEPRARVLAVHPVADLLPENQLKFYLEFSHPMRRWDPFSHVMLVDEESGEQVHDVFLMANTETWDPAGMRFTLLFDPGRIKRGLQNNIEFGPPLEEGRSYRLVVESSWPDARGVLMSEGFEKRFTVGPPDRRIPEVATWLLSAPSSGSRDVLRLDFGEALDRAYLDHAIRVKAVDGDEVEGVGRPDATGRGWDFVAKTLWAAGDYLLEVDARLEDLAGNNLNRLFDMDLHAGERLRTEAVHVLHFTVR